MILSPLPYSDPDRVVQVRTGNVVSPQLFELLQGRLSTVRDLDAEETAAHFDLLGARPALGRAFEPGDQRPYRRLAYRVGRAKAITATARKLAVLVYRSLKGDIVYTDAGAARYEARQREAALASVRRRARHLGFALVNEQTGEVIAGGVSWEA